MFILHMPPHSPGSGAGFLVGPYDALVGRWRGLDAPQATVPPKGVRSGPGPGRGHHGADRGGGASGCGVIGEGGGTGQTALAALLCFSGDLTALQQRMKGGSPETGLTPQQVGLVAGWGGA